MTNAASFTISFLTYEFVSKVLTFTMQPPVPKLSKVHFDILNLKSKRWSNFPCIFGNFLCIFSPIFAHLNNFRKCKDWCLLILHAKTVQKQPCTSIDQLQLFKFLTQPNVHDGKQAWPQMSQMISWRILHYGHVNKPGHKWVSKDMGKDTSLVMWALTVNNPPEAWLVNKAHMVHMINIVGPDC
jgi:hypothetical protein